MYHKFPDVDRLTQWLVDNKNVLDGNIEITEKLDGSNFSFYKMDGENIHCSRSGPIKPENRNNFTQSIEFANSVIDKLKPHEAIFGEHVANHHIVHYIDDRYPFYAFGVYDMERETFCKNWQSRCNKLGIPTVVKIISDEELTLENLLNLRSGESMLGPQREGIVIKDYDRQQMFKLVDPQFEESHTQKPARVPQLIDEKTQAFVDANATDMRIMKAIFRLHDEEGEAFDMPIMAKLPRAVEADIIKECGIPQDINMKQMKKLISDKSRSVLINYLNTGGI